MRISPVIPTVASLLLAALWGLSVFAGWGLEAFCTDGETSAACAERLDGASTLSGWFAMLAALLTVGAWVFPARFAVLIGGAVVAWLVAEGVLFVGGMLSR
ncbi:hypothetical protein AB0B45_16300 [Nonomuraea sp. NPDC049152]|uniref:hypothetical protein n=1 Tax=Nonomuraea sp. NPDC049152 TaxID=3154350 RepID=UPI0033D91358